MVHSGGDLVSILREFSSVVGGAFVLAGVGEGGLDSFLIFPNFLRPWS